MAASGSSFIPTSLAHADNLGEGHPRATALTPGCKLSHAVQESDKAPWWSPAVFLGLFSPIVGPGHEHSLLDAVAVPSYPRHARLERDLAIWLTEEVFDKL
ncbi:hypothetical protein TNCV_1619471 [Trichonephila clavipes]|nr:hypothetical protein TNCV_1619471 [Trichonephila clavipes]